MGKLKYKDEFCLKFTGDYSSNITTIPKEFDIIVYETPEDILNKSWNKEGADDDIHGFFDGHGQEVTMSTSEVLENIKESGFWGFVCSKNDIHLWIDYDKVSDIDIMSFLSHEIGHMQRPYKRDTMAEEMKAEHYSDITRCAYTLYVSMKKRLEETK